MQIGRILLLFFGVIPNAAFALSIAIADANGVPVANAVVTISTQTPHLEHEPGLIDNISIQQKNRNFAPKVSVIAVNQQVHFPNNDDVLHHVYSFSPAKMFEFALYGNDQSPGIVFDKPGLVVLGCNIHDHMRGYIYVTAAPYFGLTDDDGKLVLPTEQSAPYPQQFAIEIWHPEQISEQPVTKTVTFDSAEEQSKLQEFSLDVRPQRADTLDRFEQGDYE